jgi:hypothetical protein
MTRNMYEIAQNAVDLGFLPTNYSCHSVFNDDDEPEGKIDLARTTRLFRSIRTHIDQNRKSIILPSTINMGSDGMQNIICEAATDSSLTPLMDAGKFLRIAGRVYKSRKEDEPGFKEGLKEGQLYSRKIAIKSLSSHVDHVYGLPNRQEYELAIPDEMSMEEAVAYFMAEYKKKYNTGIFDDIHYHNLKPIAGYMSARTGYIFLQDVADAKIVGEACEDVMVPIGPNLVTPLGEESQFEWENVGYLYHGDQRYQPSDQHRRAVGMESMRCLQHRLINGLWPQCADNTHRYVTDSKAEIAIKRTMDNECFMPPFRACQTGFNIHAASHRACLNYIVTNAEYLTDIIDRNDVVNARIRMARKLEGIRADYNSNAPEGLRCNQDRVLAA